MKLPFEQVLYSQMNAELPSMGQMDGEEVGFPRTLNCLDVSKEVAV